MALLATGCKGEAAESCGPALDPPCPPGYFHYVDEVCNTDAGCEQVGDGLCYQMCDSDADCGGCGCHPVYLFGGPDVLGCDDFVLICGPQLMPGTCL